MSESAIFWITLASIIWIGAPLHSIARDLRELRQLARKNP